MDSRYLVVNLGLRSIRVIVFEDDGERVAKRSRSVESRISDETVEQDPTDWWEKTIEMVRELPASVRESVRYVTATSSSCNLVCTDVSGESVCPSLLVSDKRSVDQADRVAEMPELADLLSHNNFSASPSYIFPKIMWLRDNWESVFSETTTFGSSNSFLAEKLTGEPVTDYLDAEKFYYRRDGGLPETLLAELDLDASAFPDVVPVGTDVGPISEETAAELRLPEAARYVVTTYDALAAFWGSGPTADGDAGNVCGTCSSLRTYASGEVAVDGGETQIKSQYFSAPDVTTIGASNSLEGGLLEWAGSTFYETDDTPFERMEAEARESEVGADGLIFLPYLLGERAPFDDPDARGMFFGLERAHGRAEMLRSVFESTGYLTRHMVEEIEHSGGQVDRLICSGGLTRRDLACQIKADVSGKPVVLVEEVENTSLGCMILMRNATEPERRIEEITEEVVDHGTVYEPNEKRHEAYSELYELFRELYLTNTELFEKRADVLSEIEFDSLSGKRQL